MTDTRLSGPAYADAIEAGAERLADVLAGCPGDAPVPSCPEWSADDLAAHLLTTARLWGRIAARRLTDGDDVAALPPTERPSERADLLDEVGAAATELAGALRELPQDAPLWTWAPDRSAGFVLRRQAHEATLHRLDAEYTAAPDGSARTPIDALLAADGVDEALRLLYGLHPEWAVVEPLEGKTVRIVATDVGTTWLVTLARLRGTDPAGQEHDDPALLVAQDDPADGTVHPSAILAGAAEDLYAYFWRRPLVGALQRSGDQVLAAEFDAFHETARR